MLARTRDKKQFALLFEENVNYGFRRNFWAMKLLAITSASMSLAIILASMTWSWARSGGLSTECIAAAFLIVVYLSFVLVRLRPDWVRIPAIAYARQLLAACDVLSATTTAPAP